MDEISVLSSMAMRGLLADLAASWTGRVTLEAVGGVDAARRVREGETVDVVVMADGPMRALEADAFLVPGSLQPMAISTMAIAMRTGDVPPSLADASAVRRAIEAAERVGYSTGPSGEYLLRLLDQWGIRHPLGDRLVQAPPGVPVAQLLANGTVGLAFQQMSELVGVPGVSVVGPLPPEIQLETIFTVGVTMTARDPQTARRFITVLTAREAITIKDRHGLLSTPTD